MVFSNKISIMGIRFRNQVEQIASTTCPHGRLSVSSTPHVFHHSPLNRCGAHHILLDITTARRFYAASQRWLQAPSRAVSVSFHSATASTCWMLSRNIHRRTQTGLMLTPWRTRTLVCHNVTQFVKPRRSKT